MTINKLLVLVVCAAVTHCTEDCVFNLELNGKNIQFDLVSFLDTQSTEENNLYTINIKLCGNKEQQSTCDGIRSKICLIKENDKIDIGSKFEEIKLDEKNQLVITLEGNKTYEKNKKHTTNVTFICDKSINEKKIVYKPTIDSFKHIIEISSLVACPVDDLDIRKMCTVSIPNSNYKFNLNLLRRLTTDYLVENQNRRFLVNICGHLVDNKCGVSTTICDITDASNSRICAVENNKRDKLFFDTESKNVKLIQYERQFKKQKGRKVEIIFKCNESITPEKTKPEFLKEENYPKGSTSYNVFYFEVATSTVCIPRMTSCEIYANSARINLRTFHKRVGNWMVKNYKNGGTFYLNFCSYLNPYGESVPESCIDGKTSACYVNNTSKKGISIGSSQIGPYFKGSSTQLHYIDGEDCMNYSLKWTTIIHFTCADKSELVHVLTDFTSCTHVFQWNSREACNSLFKRKNQCIAADPYYDSIIYNITALKDQSFKVNGDDNEDKFRFSICSPLQTPCNGILESAACWSSRGYEINIGLFTEEVVFDNGKIYISMQGEKCDNNGPNSYTTIRFICDYSDSKNIKIIKNLEECLFEFLIYTKYACSQEFKTPDCIVNDRLGNIYDLSNLTKLNSNYEIPIKGKKKIILNVCHSVINNDINGLNCQLNSGICLVESNNLLFSDRYKNLGNVDKSPYIVENKILLEMNNGFYDRNTITSVIEFVCSDQNNGPVFINEFNHKFTFKWETPLVCPYSHKQSQKLEVIEKNDGYGNIPIHMFTEFPRGVSYFDLVSLKGTYVVTDDGQPKYYINMCMPGKNINGGIMEINGKNYSIGYPLTPPSIDMEGIINIDFKNGDMCGDEMKMNMRRKYSTKIQLICDDIEGKPIVIKTNRKCVLQFLWNTNKVCPKKLFEFNGCTREVSIIGYRKDFSNNKNIDMKNIFYTTKFLDNSTNTLFEVNVCDHISNGFVCVNSSIYFSNMSFQYDVNKNQLIANVQNINSTTLKIIIKCSRSVDDLAGPKIVLNGDEIIINIYSEKLCCMDYTDHTNEEICKNDSLADISTTSIITTTSAIENEFSTDIQNHKLNETYSDESVPLFKELTEESNIYKEEEDNNSSSQQMRGITDNSNFTDILPLKKKVSALSGIAFHSGIILTVLLLMILIWLVRWKLLKEIRKLFYYIPLARRRRESYSSNLINLD